MLGLSTAIATSTGYLQHYHPIGNATDAEMEIHTDTDNYMDSVADADTTVNHMDMVTDAHTITAGRTRLHGLLHAHDLARTRSSHVKHSLLITRCLTVISLNEQRNKNANSSLATQNSDSPTR